MLRLSVPRGDHLRPRGSGIFAGSIPSLEIPPHILHHSSLSAPPRTQFTYWGTAVTTVAADTGGVFDDWEGTFDYGLYKVITLAQI